MSETISGRCLCGAVRFEAAQAADKFGEVILCHCGMCRRWGGGLPFAFILARVSLEKSDALKWKQTSDWGERGFCGECGACLFCREQGGSEGEWDVAVGALDSQANLKIARHIFIDDKPDFYDLADAAPRVTGAVCVARILGELKARHGDGMIAAVMKQIRARNGDAFAAEVEKNLQSGGE